MYSINGIGTTLYGKREIEPDGSYITTKWFVLLLLPIFPICSYRVWRGQTKTTLLLPGAKTEYTMTKVLLNKKQIINTYLAIWSVALVIGLLIYLDS